MGQAVAEHQNLHRAHLPDAPAQVLLLVDGPEVDEAARKLLNKALSIAASAAVATGLATPSPEPAARIDAALAAAKRAFFSYPIARGFERFGRLYAVSW